MTYLIANLNLKYNDLTHKEINEYLKFRLEKVSVNYNIIKINNRIIIINLVELDRKQTLRLIKKIKLDYLSLIFNIDIIENIIYLNNDSLNENKENKNKENKNKKNKNKENKNKDNKNKDNKNNKNNIINIFNEIKKNINNQNSKNKKFRNKKSNLIIKKEYKINFIKNDNNILPEEFKNIKKITFSSFTSKKKANLENPKIIINSYIFKNENTIVFATNLITKKFIDFKMNILPGFMPTVTDYNLSNTLFNIANIKEDTIILDPFCGIGGFFINNPYENKKILNELHEEVIKKLKLNLEFLKVRNYIIKNYDGLRLSEIINSKKEYSIITDVPYGKSCKLSTNHFIFFEEFLKDSIRYSKTIVIALPLFNNKDEESYKKIINKYNLKISLEHKIFINKSLSKFIIKIENII